MGTNIKAGKGSFRLEDMVEPKTFFDLGCWSTGRTGSKILNLTISEKHMYLVSRLKESGMFRVSNTQMHRGLLILGLLTECFHNHIYEEKAINFIKQSRMARQKFNVVELTNAIGFLDKNDSSDNMLLQTFIKHGKCQYGTYVSGFIPNLISPNTKSYGVVDKVIISPEIKNLCNNFSKEPPTDNRFKLTRNKSNEHICMWMPNHIKIIVFGLLKSGIVNTRLMSDIYRGAYIMGLYVLCRWVILDNLLLEEYLFSKILHDIYDYLSENV